MTDFVHVANLTLSSKDSKGQYPETKWVGKSYFHPKTRRVYRCTGFVWNSTNDEWYVYFSRTGCQVSFCRSIPEFKEKFVQIENDGRIDDDE